MMWSKTIYIDTFDVYFEITIHRSRIHVYRPIFTRYTYLYLHWYGYVDGEMRESNRDGEGGDTDV